MCKAFALRMLCISLLSWFVVHSWSLLSPLFSSSLWFMTLISGRTFSLGCGCPAATYYLVCHKNTNLRGQPHFTAWQVEAQRKIVSWCSLTSEWNTHFISSCTVCTNAMNDHDKFLTWIVDYAHGTTLHYYTIKLPHTILPHRCWIASVIMWGIVKKLLKEVRGQSLRPFPNRLKTGIMRTPDNRDHNLSDMHNWALLGKIIINLCVSHGVAINQKKHNPTLPLCLSLPLAHLLPLSRP